LQKLKFPNYQTCLFNQVFKKKWTNEINQIDFLSFLIVNQSDTFGFKNYQGKKVKKNFELSIIVNKNSVNHLIEAWSCIDLMEVLFKLSKGNYYLKIKEMFDWPIANVPEILVIGMAMFQSEGDDFLYEEVINEAMPLFLGNHTNSIPVLEEVWNLNKDLVIRTICSMYRNSPDLMNLSKILDITQKLKESLIPIVSCNDHYFTVNLAILAVKRDFLHIDQWLAERISKVGDDFIESLLNYIKENVIVQCKDVTSQSIKDNILEKCQLSLESLAIIFENLTPNKIGKNPKVSKRIEAEITNTYKAIFEIFDELQVQPPNSEEIEEAANKLYQSLFHGELTVEEVIEKMKAYKNSQNQKESEIYACMIHSLLDEYRFFHQYPEKELTIIATMFGQIINQKLLDGIIETIALKYVLEGLKKGNGNMYIFATLALEQFVDKLQSSPQYLQNLISIPAIKNNPNLYEKINDKFNEMSMKSKNKLEDGSYQKSGNNNFIVFDSQHEDKRGEKLNVKMPEFNKDKFNNVYFNVSNAANVHSSQFNMMQNNNVLPGQYSSKGITNTVPGMQGAQNLQASLQGTPYYSGENLNNLNFYPYNMRKDNMQNPYEDDMEKGGLEEGFQGIPQYIPKYKSGEDSKLLLKSDLEGEYTKGAINVQNFNSGDKASFNKTKLRNPVSSQSNYANLTQILGDGESSVQAPSQDIIDKINFIFNSMSKNNLADKSNELKNILSNDYVIRWFSNFFIVNRVSAESNNHSIYHELITYIDSKDLNSLMIKDTVSFIKKLLLSENIARDPKEKKVLTNLGSWLGNLTIAKNKPVLAKDLDLKEIIFEAYENGKLTAIVAFVCKILEHSAKTKVFHPKNPWIQALLSVLAELYFKPSLKTNLKFEIENIFKRLELDLSSFPQTRVLDNLNVCSNSQDFTPKSSGNMTNETEFDANDLHKILSKQDQYLNDIILFISRTQPNIIVKSELLNIITNSLFNAINEILAPVVERAVNISQVTTRELILKDFAYEKDESKFRNAANLCIKSLAGSLAMVTCKEPLRIGYNNQLKENFLKKGIEPETIEALNNTINNTEILEIGSSFIQNYVIKRAIDKIEKDKIIMEELDKRRKGRPLEIRPDLVNKIKQLPEMLRPSPSGLTPDQMKIYEDFDKIYDRNNSGNTNYNNKLALLKKIIPALKEVLDSYPSPKLINKYEMCMKNIQFITNSEDTDYQEEDEHLFVLSKMISESKVSDIAVAYELLNVSFKYIISASKTQNLSLVNINSEILKGWVKLHPSLSKEITNLLLNSDDIYVRFKMDLHYYFFKKNIINMDEYENFISDYFQETSMINVVRKLISNLIEKNVLSISSFKKIPSYMIDPTVSCDYFDLFAKKNTYCGSSKDVSIVDFKLYNIKDYNSYVNFRENCKYAMKLMLNMMYQNFDLEQIKIKLKDFLESSIIKIEEQFVVFIMMTTEMAVKSMLVYDPDNTLYPETQAKCIMNILNIVPSTTNKLKMFENILFGIFKVFHYDYSKNLHNFNQRPYYKLIMNIIYYLYTADNTEDMFNGYKRLQYFNILADVLRFMKPQHYPGFVLAWIDILSSKNFSATFLEFDSTGKLNKENIPKYEKYLLLLIDLLSYLKAFNSEIISDFNSKVLVDSVHKFMFLLSNSYPEFLCYYYYIIIASLPPGDSFLQLKNIILHSAPSDIEQPDPFYDEFKVDSLPDISKNSVVLFEIGSILNDYGYKSIIDEFIETKNENLMEELYKKLNKKDKDQSHNYLVINAIVIYWSLNIIKNKTEKRKMSNQEVLEFFIKMMKNLEPENRDHLINSILNELRYPSNQTYYFSCLLLCIFFEIKNEQIEEHILRY
jgi:hypothetical protein